MASMSIVDSEEGTFRPLLMLAVLRFHNIQNNGDPILIVRPDQALVSVSSVRPHNPISSETALGSFMIRDDDSRPRLQRQLPRVFILIPLDRRVLMKHLVHVQRCK